jgi:hypothetical protein
MKVLQDRIVKAMESKDETFHAMLQDVRQCREHVDVSTFSPEARKQIQSLFQLPEDTRDAITAHRVLNLIHYHAMHERFSDVNSTFGETFDWILDTSGGKSDHAVNGDGHHSLTLASNPEVGSPTYTRETCGDSGMRECARDCLIRWLQSGKGFFHLAGKIGSGKSTLMKFICSHAQTRKFLENWADDKRLVMAKFFFWRPGIKQQKTLSGLSQALLYEILQECRELIPMALPTLWSQAESVPWQSEAKSTVDHDQIQKALCNLFSDPNILAEYRFCFFIDGLDEYEENTSESYHTMIRLLKSWVEMAPDNVKLCVSSREYTVFTDAFKRDRNLRLQDLTRIDIKEYVRGRLEIPSSYLEEPGFEGAKEQLIDRILDNADGVFLWVTLVVKSVNEGLRYQDPFSDIIAKIDRMPPKLEQLFVHLLMEIDDSRRDQVYYTFAYALQRQQLPDVRVTVFGYSFLRQYLQNPRFAIDTDEPWVQKSEQQIQDSVDRARVRVIELSKGLLEVHLEEECVVELCFAKPLRSVIKATHRSIQEFLGEGLRPECVASASVQELAEYQYQDRDSVFEETPSAFWSKYINKTQHSRLRNFDINDAICQTYVAELRSCTSNMLGLMSDDPIMSDHMHVHFASPLANIVRFLCSCHKADQFRHFQYLDFLQVHILRAQGIKYDEFYRVWLCGTTRHELRFSLFKDLILGGNAVPKVGVSVFHQAACAGYLDFVKWEIDRRPDLLKANDKAFLLFKVVMEGISHCTPGTPQLLEWLLGQFPASPNAGQTAEPQGVNLQTLWQFFFRWLGAPVFNYDSRPPDSFSLASVLVMFIRAGAALDVQFVTPSLYQIRADPHDSAGDFLGKDNASEFSVGSSVRRRDSWSSTVLIQDTPYFLILHTDGTPLFAEQPFVDSHNSRGHLVAFLHRRGGQASLLEVIENYFSKDDINLIKDAIDERHSQSTDQDTKQIGQGDLQEAPKKPRAFPVENHQRDVGELRVLFNISHLGSYILVLFGNNPPDIPYILHALIADTGILIGLILQRLYSAVFG